MGRFKHTHTLIEWKMETAVLLRTLLFVRLSSRPAGGKKNMLIKTAPDLVKYAMMLGDTFALASHWARVTKKTTHCPRRTARKRAPCGRRGRGK